MALDTKIRLAIEAKEPDQRTAEEADLLERHLLTESEEAGLRTEILEGGLYAGATDAQAWMLFRTHDRLDPDAPPDAPAFLESRRSAVLGPAGRKARAADIASLMAERREVENG